MKDQSSPIPLVILDVQDAIDRPNWDGKNNPEYVVVIQRLLDHWRSNGWPVLYVKPINRLLHPAITSMAPGMASRKALPR